MPQGLRLTFATMDDTFLQSPTNLQQIYIILLYLFRRLVINFTSYTNLCCSLQLRPISMPLAFLSYGLKHWTWKHITNLNYKFFSCNTVLLVWIKNYLTHCTAVAGSGLQQNSEGSICQIQSFPRSRSHRSERKGFQNWSSRKYGRGDAGWCIGRNRNGSDFRRLENYTRKWGRSSSWILGKH